MAAIDTARGPLIGANTGRIGVVTGDHRSILTSNSESVVLKVNSGFLHQLIVDNIGASWQIDVYDDITTSGPQHKMLTWTSATAGTLAGVGQFPLQIPMSNGIVIVESGTTAGHAVLVWS